MVAPVTATNISVIAFVIHVLRIIHTLDVADCSGVRVQVNQDGFELNIIYQILVYADNVNILGGSVHTIKKNTDALVVASKQIGLEVNADKSKYMVMSRDQNAGRSRNIKTYI